MSDQPLIERPEQNTSQPFHEMAAAIEHNPGQGFGGAVVIVPPTGGGEPISILTFDSQGDLAQFYSSIQSRIQIRVAELDNRQRIAGQGAFR